MEMGNVFGRLVLGLAVLFFSSCDRTISTTDAGQPKNGKDHKTKVYKIKPPSGLHDTLKVSGRSAVFFMAGPKQLNLVKEAVSEPGFESMSHDCFYQMRNSRNVLRQYWSAVQIIETSGSRWVEFEFADKSKKWIDLDKNNELCGIFLFNGIKDPVLVDMTNIDTQVEYYFNQ
jgi:hypothetical protein